MGQRDNTHVKRKCSPQNGKQSFEVQFYLLAGNKSLEKYIIWMKDIQDKFIRTNPSWEHIWDFMMKLTLKDVKASIQATFREYTPTTSFKDPV